MSIVPHFISPDLASFKDDILDYSTSGKAATYRTGTDGTTSGTTFSSASTTFVTANVGMTIAIEHVGYALVTAKPTDHTLTLDTSFDAATSLRFCVGAHAAIEKEAFTMLKNDAVYGWSRTIMDNNGFARSIHVKGLREITGGVADDGISVTDYDFMGELEATETMFDDAHRYATLWRIFRKEAVQGGQNWRDMAADFAKDYYGCLQAAIERYGRKLQDDGTVPALVPTDGIIFARLERT